MGRKQNENLIPNSKRSPKEVRKNGKKGGIKSGIARREKKTMRETLEMFMTMPVNDGMLDDLKDFKSVKDVNGKNISVQEAIVMAQVVKAMKGDAKAAKFVADIFDQQAAKDSEGVTIVDDY